MATTLASAPSGSLPASHKTAHKVDSQSSANLTKRLQSELMGLMVRMSLKGFPFPNCVQMSGHSDISAFPVDDANLQNWVGRITGPKDTVYEGLSFKISIHFSSSFPYSPPLIKFTTPLYHPNVALQGDICLDILKDEAWSPSLSVTNVLLSLQSLLGEPNNRSPLNVEAADLWDKPTEFKAQLMKHYTPIADDD